MKKQLSLLFSIVAIFSLISCNNQQPSKHESSKKESSVETTSEVISSSTNTTTSEDTSISSGSSSNTQQSDSSDSSTTSSSNEQNETYYHVVFVNYDETTVLYETDVLKGSTATYSGEAPTKEEDDEFTYEFIGWDKELTDIQSNTTFTAQFKAVAKENWGPIIWF